MALQSSVNIYNAVGVIGELAFAGPGTPHRAQPYNLVSGSYDNVVGYAYTVSGYANPNASGAAPVAGTAQVGGTGAFAGILVNPKEYVLYGDSSSPLNPSLVLPDYSIGSLLDMGFIGVSLPGPANPGDLVSYDVLTGALNSYPKTTSFTGSISTTTLTVTALSAGKISVGQLLTGANVTPGTYITALGTGKGSTGTYTVSVSQTAASGTITADNTPQASFSVTASIAPGSTPATDPSVLNVTAVGSGQIRIGSQLFGTGIPDNTVVTGFGTGVGGTGTYTVNQINLTVSSGTVTGDTNVKVPGAEVYRYAPNSTGGYAIIKLTN